MYWILLLSIHKIKCNKIQYLVTYCIYLIGSFASNLAILETVNFTKSPKIDTHEYE